MAERLAPYREHVMETCLRRMIESPRSHGAEVIAIVLPQPGYEARLGERVEPLRTVLADEGVPVIDLLAAFGDEDPASLWVRPFDRHPNEAGHGMLFDMLYEKIVSDPELARIVLGTAP